MTSGPFVPTLAKPTRIAMAGDDCSLHFDLEDLTPKQQADHLSNQVLTAMLQVALNYMGKPEDQICLYDTFNEPPWQEALSRYRDMFESMGLNIVSLDNVSFHPFDAYYESVAQSTAAQNSLYMVSHSNKEIHQDHSLLAMSQDLNSKIHFAEHAPDFGIPTPQTIVTSKGELDNQIISQPTMLKTLGLAGARNVTVVSSNEEASEYLAEYDDDMAVILQERINLDAYTEMTVDLEVTDMHVEITNVRRIMFADGLWVGNLLGPDVVLSDTQVEELLKVGRYAQSHGYQHPDGFNLGIDFFVKDAGAGPDILVTEINARWTGGLFPAELIRQLNIGDRQVVAFIDMCPPDRFSEYVTFQARYLHTRTQGEFSIAPMGFAPYPTSLDGKDYLFVWQIVIDDFEAFKKVKEEELGPEVLISAPAISVEL